MQVTPALDAPVNKGHLCSKGRYAFEFTHFPDRVTEPMIRDGGAWRAVSWEEVTAHVAARLREIVAAHGPDSVGVLGSARATNEENYVAQKFACVVLGTNNIDCCARVCHAPTAAAMKRMLGTGAAANSFDDIERATAPHLQHPDFPAEKIHRLMRSLAARTHQHDHPLRIGRTVIFKEPIRAPREIGEAIHRPLHDARTRRVKRIHRLARLRPMLAHALFVDHRPQHFVRQQRDLRYFV